VKNITFYFNEMKVSML